MAAQVGVLYILSGIGWSILSMLFIKNNISFGAFGALFGLLGAILVVEILPPLDKIVACFLVVFENAYTKKALCAIVKRGGFCFPRLAAFNMRLPSSKATIHIYVFLKLTHNNPSSPTIQAPNILRGVALTSFQD
ncbi:hypothetical protein Ccrd_026686, partial [Cynara cardunculus var. scolymus]